MFSNPGHLFVLDTCIGHTREKHPLSGAKKRTYERKKTSAIKRQGGLRHCKYLADHVAAAGPLVAIHRAAPVLQEVSKGGHTSLQKSDPLSKPTPWDGMWHGY